jgi:RNA polymerase sigma-70 factor (ECF subfamily)
MFLADEARKKRDEKWLGRLLAGDHEAFAEFVDKYKEMIFLCCRTLGLRKDEIEDVASETFMAAYKGIGRYRGHAELSTWLWGIAYRQGVNYLRKNRMVRQAHHPERSRGRENQLLADPPFLPLARGRGANGGNIQALALPQSFDSAAACSELAESDGEPVEPLAELESKEQAELVWEAVEQLPGLWAMAIVLFYREEREVKEIAKIMRVRQNTVKTYLFRGRKRLKELLAGVVGENIDASR